MTLLTVDELTEGTRLAALCASLSMLKKKALHASATLDAAKNIENAELRRQSLATLSTYFDFLQPDRQLATRIDISPIIILMNKAALNYQHGEDTGAIHISRCGRQAQDADDVVQSVVFSFRTATQQLVVTIPLTNRFRAGISFADASTAPLVARLNGEVFPSDTPAFAAIAAMFYMAALQYAGNSWHFLSQPTDAECDDARQVLQDSSPVFTATAQLPDVYQMVKTIKQA